MKRNVRHAITATAVLLSSLFIQLSPLLWAQEKQRKQPPPEFSGSYRPPTITTPAPRAEVFALIDVAVLLLVLGLGAYIVLNQRSRRDLRILTIFSLLYFGLYRQGCVCAVGSIQNVALALGHNGYTLPFVVGAFFLIPLVFALFCGRIFCAAACPLGALQEVVLQRPLRVPAAVEHTLSLLPYLYLGAGVLFAATGSAFVICQYDPFIAFFRFGGTAGMVTFGAALLLMATVIGRPYCRFLCPYGVLLRWVSAFSRWQVRITPTTCINCHLCADACPYGAIKPPTPEITGEDRRSARRRLARLIVVLPFLLASMAWLGYMSSPVLARMDHTVTLAERVWLEERGRVNGTTDESKAFEKTGQPSNQLYAEALAMQKRFKLGGTLFGAWVGLVIGFKLISLSLRRRQPEYETDPAACLSCARCYTACPPEQQRLITLADITMGRAVNGPVPLVNGDRTPVKVENP